MSEDQLLPLADDKESMHTTTDLRNEAEEAVRVYHSRTQAEKTDAEGVFTAGMSLYIEVEGSTTPIVVIPKEKTLLGRKDPTSGETPDVDLSLYAAYQMGVSRIHAFIHHDQSRLFLHDLGSRNGTYLNGQRLTPQQPGLLHDGDEVRLGKIVLRISYRQADV
jgi:hypothetical protein